MWNVVFCYIDEWLAELDQGTKDCITAAVEILAEEGPTLEKIERANEQ